ncbi:MAG: hypothetical protein IT158_11145 [Bryobacterales bacterium]|nr:hypothetical protein [Bryobacterales bacterium]
MQTRRASQRGFNLLATGASISALVATLGLATDMARMYVVKNELQAYVDAAAMAAGYELDGSLDGIAAARAAAAAGPNGANTPNRWDFATKTVTGVQSSFAQTFTGAYLASPGSGTDYRFVKVDASATVPLYFLTIVPKVGASRTVRASAVAGQALVDTLGEGVAPFSPDAHDPSDPDFGFTRGQKYTLRWPPPGQRSKHYCPGDKDFVPGGGSSDRGYIDVGQGKGDAALHDAIVNNNYYLAYPLTIGSVIQHVTGEKSVTPSMDERFNQDTDTASNTYEQYQRGGGNGRRLITLPVNNGGDPSVVIGFGQFLLPPNSCGNSNVTPCCGEYVGPGLISGKKKAGGGTGMYVVKLFQ